MKNAWKRTLSGVAAVMAACSIFAAPVSAGWIPSGEKWWYKNSDGSYPQSGWSQISDKWYRFDASGWMLTGWQKVGKVWYYLGTDGAMKTGWQKVGQSWYYLGTDGVMKTGWLKLDGKSYYLKASGAMVTGNITIDGKSCTFSASGVLEESAANHIVYWGETGNRYHIDPYCRSFHGKAACSGSLETAKANGRERWCGICSKGWTDAHFEEVGNPYAE